MFRTEFSNGRRTSRKGRNGDKQVKENDHFECSYVFIGLFATKLGQAWRFTSGDELGERILDLGNGFLEAMQSLLPSFYPLDLLVGAVVALLIRLVVYEKSKNAKKYRRNVEYGSARWGKPEDIAPYIDPDLRNNVILTQTERLTMNNRPKDPKTARNKNVLIVGGSGSGKTRFFIKPSAPVRAV